MLTVFNFFLPKLRNPLLSSFDFEDNFALEMFLVVLRPERDDVVHRANNLPFLICFSMFFEWLNVPPFSEALFCPCRLLADFSSEFRSPPAPRAVIFSLRIALVRVRAPECCTISSIRAIG